MTMTVDEALENVSTQLQQAGLEDPRMESEFLVSAALGIARPQLFLEKSQPIPESQMSTLKGWAESRAQRWPLAYVLGNHPFGDLLLKISPAVLIPRPETEAWVHDLMEQMATAPKALTVVDVGTGSGAIALTLVQNPRVKKIYGIDKSLEALEVARENASLYDRGQTCEWLCGDLLDALPANVSPDVIVANLPYIASAELNWLSPEVGREPRTALDGGVRGDEIIFRLIAQAEARMSVNAALWLEIGHDQAASVSKRLQDGAWAQVTVDKDLAGLSRVVRATRGEPLWTC